MYIIIYKIFQNNDYFHYIYIMEIIIILEYFFLYIYIYIYIHSGYGKYSDPLKFFTLCYIAAIC